MQYFYNEGKKTMPCYVWHESSDTANISYAKKGLIFVFLIEKEEIKRSEQCSSPSKYAGQLLGLSLFQQFGQHLTQEAHCGLIQFPKLYYLKTQSQRWL